MICNLGDPMSLRHPVVAECEQSSTVNILRVCWSVLQCVAVCCSVLQCNLKSRPLSIYSSTVNPSGFFTSTVKSSGFFTKKRATNYRALVRKTTYQDSSNLNSRLLWIYEPSADCTKFTVGKSSKGSSGDSRPAVKHSSSTSRQARRLKWKKKGNETKQLPNSVSRQVSIRH